MSRNYSFEIEPVSNGAILIIAEESGYSKTEKKIAYKDDEMERLITEIAKRINYRMGDSSTDIESSFKYPKKELV